MQFIVICISSYILIGVLGIEPECSRFAYDEQLLSKVIRMEINTENYFERNREIVEDLKKEISTIKADKATMSDTVLAMSKEIERLKGERDVLKQNFDELKKENTEQFNAFVEDISNFTEKMNRSIEGLGSTYIRWGSSVCPSTASIVYKGYTAGRFQTSKGSGTNNLCLPSIPTWSKYVDGVRNDRRAYIYGTEIDSLDYPDIFSYPVNDQDLSCAVCQTKKSSIIMVPARRDCYRDWSLEYRGYLVAGSHGNFGNEYICLDENPEYIKHGSRNDDQHILYLVEARCGSLPCPPYVEGRELTCAVCSK